MSSKRKGARSEWKVRDHYEGLGWYVQRAGGSLGIWDLIGLHPDLGIILVQVKTNCNPRKAELDRMRNFQCHSSWKKILAIVRDYRGIEFYEV